MSQIDKRIFVFSNFLSHASVFYILKALKKLGFETKLIGPESGYEGHIYLSPDGDVLDIFRKYDKPYLSLFVETGTQTKFFPENIHKIPVRTAFWAIDNHLNFRWHKEYAVLFDYVFFAQPSLIPWAKRFNLNTFLLMNACDPEIHRDYNLNKEYDVVFVGKLLKKRRQFFDYLKRKYSDIKIGIFEKIYLDEMAKTYSLGRIGFNLPVRKDINMRTFEIPACGLLLFTPELTGMNEIFPADSCVYYKNVTQLSELLNRFLKNEPDELERRRKKGEEIVRRNHTYETRIGEMLRTIEENEPARGKRTEVHLSLLFSHRNAKDGKRRLKYLFLSFRKYPLFTIFYYTKYFVYYMVEAILKNLKRWPY